MKLTQLGFLITVKLYTWVFWRWGCLRSSVPVKTLRSQPFGILKVHSPWEYLRILVPGNTLGSLSLGLSQVFIPSEYIGFTVPGNASGSQSLWISWRGADPCNLYLKLSPDVAYTSPNEFCHLIGLFWFARSRKCPLSEPLLFLHLTILAHGNTFLLNFLADSWQNTWNLNVDISRNVTAHWFFMFLYWIVMSMRTKSGVNPDRICLGATCPPLQASVARGERNRERV